MWVTTPLAAFTQTWADHSWVRLDAQVHTYMVEFVSILLSIRLMLILANLPCIQQAKAILTEHPLSLQ